MTSDGTYNYTWDAAGRLVSVDNGSTVSYVYNALGLDGYNPADPCSDTEFYISHAQCGGTLY